MRTRKLLSIVAAAGLAIGCGAERTSRYDSDGSTTDTVGEDGSTDTFVGPPLPDEDGDTIADEDEGRGANVDTDGDTVPDYLDDDSDGDTIPDYMEAGDGDNRTPPHDTDFDGDPDFRDQDSDGNGILDASEGIADTDGDGTHDASDLDNDGDTIGDSEEIGPDASSPIDADGDTIPDYMDTDSDGDTIGDRYEGPASSDTDGDGTPDRHDLDSDEDGLSDADEAGDADPATPPTDTDGDGVYDFRDADSDNDGLSDGWEVANGTDPYAEDSDGDSVPDLIEVGAGTDPNDPGSDPTTEGNFYFLVPYEEDPDPAMDTLVFSTSLQMADVFFLMDTTGSMGGEISNLKSSLSTIIPQVAAIIPNVWFGVGRFDDYPVSPYGGTSDVVYQLLQRMTDNVALAQNGVDALDRHWGNDGSESSVPALWATATGNGLGGYLPPTSVCSDTEVGYPCFRPGAVPIIVHITDASFHNGPGNYDPYGGISPAPTYNEAVVALNAIHAKVIGIWSTGGVGPVQDHVTAIATDTGAVDVGGNPLVFSVDGTGSGLGGEVVSAINVLANQVPIDISAEGRDDETDAEDATQFIDHIEPNTAGGVEDPLDPGTFCVSGLSTGEVEPPDTIPDYFVDVLPGETVCFDIYAARNTTVEPTEEPQVFMAYVDVLGDLVTVLDTREVFFLVPPELQGPGIPE
jgi:hypothetical protein